ncbi:MAG: TlpA family protein disulfide reductase [Chloroflexi bacterium]|nr:TlpA family protein disulfide reductase [Chloroflexota bacterium]
MQNDPENDTLRRDGQPSGLTVVIAIGLAAGLLMAVLTVFGGQLTAILTGTNRSATPIPDRVRVGETAPDFTAETLGGDPVTLSGLGGQVVAVNFWATWCVPCRTEMPALQAASEANDNLTIVAVNVGERERPVSEFVDELGLTFTIALDPSEDISNLYGVRGLPVTVWIDPDGMVRFEHIGGLTAAQIDQYIAELAAQ